MEPSLKLEEKNPLGMIYFFKPQFVAQRNIKIFRQPENCVTTELTMNNNHDKQVGRFIIIQR